MTKGYTILDKQTQDYQRLHTKHNKLNTPVHVLSFKMGRKRLSSAEHTLVCKSIETKMDSVRVT